MERLWGSSRRIAADAKGTGARTELTMIRLFGVCILLLPLALTGCMSHSEIVKEELDSSAQRFVGKSTDYLLMEMGASDFKEKLSTGEVVWTYRKQKTGEKKGMTITIGGAGKDSSRPLSTWYETINFIVGPDGIVKKYFTSVD